MIKTKDYMNRDMLRLEPGDTIICNGIKATIKETGTSKELTKTIEVEQPVFNNYEITHTVDPNDPLQVYFVLEN